MAIHFDVDTVDSNEIVLGLGAEPDGLSGAEVRRIVADAAAAVDVVGFTVAEYFLRQVMHLQSILQGLPLIDGPSTRERPIQRQVRPALMSRLASHDGSAAVGSRHRYRAGRRSAVTLVRYFVKYRTARPACSGMTHCMSS